MSRLLARLLQLHAAHERGGSRGAGSGGGGSSCGDGGCGSGSGVLLAGSCGSPSESAVAASSALLRLPTPHRPPVLGIRFHCLCSKDALTSAMRELEVGLRAVFDLRDRRRHPLPCFDFRGAVLLIRRVWLAWSMTGTVEVTDQSFSHHVQGRDARITLCAGAGAGDEASVLSTAPQAFSKSAASERHFGEDACALVCDAGSDYNLTRSPSESLRLSADAVAVADGADACAVAAAYATPTATRTPLAAQATGTCQQGAWPGGDISGLESGLGLGPGSGTGTGTGSPSAVGVRARVRSLTTSGRQCDTWWPTGSPSGRASQSLVKFRPAAARGSSTGTGTQAASAGARAGATTTCTAGTGTTASTSCTAAATGAGAPVVAVGASGGRGSTGSSGTGSSRARRNGRRGAGCTVVGDCSQAATGSATDARASGCDGPSDSETDHDEWEAC